MFCICFVFYRVFIKYTSGYSNIEKGTVRLSHKNAVILSEILMCDLKFFYE
ncbi:XRE family transcriptional regulator [Listeria monocytogenes]|nr:XRE family transcriptional regulator [Listeria monocytogenes]